MFFKGEKLFLSITAASAGTSFIWPSDKERCAIEAVGIEF